MPFWKGCCSYDIARRKVKRNQKVFSSNNSLPQPSFDGSSEFGGTVRESAEAWIWVALHPFLNTRIFCSKLCTVDLGGSSRLLDSLCTAYICCNDKALDLSILCRLEGARDLSERLLRIIQDDSGSCLLELYIDKAPSLCKLFLSFLCNLVPGLNLALCVHVGNRKNHKREPFRGHLPMQHEFSMNWLHQK